jgi:DNA-binding FrmR family transcriptional regulator
MHTRVQKRLARIVGHMQGVSRMIAAEKSCVEILQQMAAVIGALVTTRKLFIEDHLRGCIVEAVRSGASGDAVEEVERVLSLLG